MANREIRAAAAGVLAIAALMVVCTVGAPPPLHAQAPFTADVTPPAFEVASVKPNPSGDGRVSIGMQPGGRFTAINVPLRMLIRYAYQLQDFQLEGGPDWLGDRFDIVAKAEGDVPPGAPGTAGPMQLMLRTLLAERFTLRVHHETRALPVYALTLARRDGKLGSQLRQAAVDCAAAMAAARGRGGSAPALPRQGDRPNCGISVGPGRFAAGSVSLAQLATSLSQPVNRIVIDRTGLTGSFDIDLQWTPEQLPPRAVGTPADQPLRINGMDIDPNGPSIFTAVQEQLGLKLEPGRGPVDVLVIDEVTRPSPD